MAVQEWRTATAAENGLRDRCGSHPHAQTQLPAQVCPAQITFGSLLHLKDIQYVSIPLLSDLTLLNLHANILQVGLMQHIASIRMHVCVFVQPFLLSAGRPRFFSKIGHGAVKGNVALSFFPFQSSGGRLSYLGCLAMSASVPSCMLRICWKVSDCTAPLDYGVVGCPPLLGYDDSAVWA